MQKKSAVAFLSAVLGLAFAGDACAFNMFKEFGSRLTADSMKPFTRDLGGLIGAADFHSASVTGFPGFDIGVVGSFQTKPDKDNTILRDAGCRRLWRADNTGGSGPAQEFRPCGQKHAHR